LAAAGTPGEGTQPEGRQESERYLNPTIKRSVPSPQREGTPPRDRADAGGKSTEQHRRTRRTRRRRRRRQAAALAAALSPREGTQPEGRQESERYLNPTIKRSVPSPQREGTPPSGKLPAGWCPSPEQPPPRKSVVFDDADTDARALRRKRRRQRVRKKYELKERAKSEAAEQDFKFFRRETRRRVRAGLPTRPPPPHAFLTRHWTSALATDPEWATWIRSEIEFGMR